ncbi:MAG TPA: hypothetical protein VJ600_06365 [Holophagaceae bacterium]|nr:hypothetical protein [Holophagaceae bacterium]
MEAIRQDTRQVVDRLERQVASLRRSLWFMTLLVFGGAGGFAWWQLHHRAVTPTALRLRNLVIEDDHGAARVVIGGAEGGGIRLLDAQGQERGSLLLMEDGVAALALKDARGFPLLKASATTDQGAELTLADPKKDAVIFGTVPGPTLQMRKGDRMVFKQPYDAQDMK